jgi:hypothetical protein
LKFPIFPLLSAGGGEHSERGEDGERRGPRDPESDFCLVAIGHELAARIHHSAAGGAKRYGPASLPHAGNGSGNLLHPVEIGLNKNEARKSGAPS